METHAVLAEKYLKNKERAKWFDEIIWFVRKKRDVQKEQIEEWETLREFASNIKEHTISNLDKYLLQFEANAKKNGIQVHWAKNGKEHNKIVEGILIKNRAKLIVKSKSMLTEECGMNEFLHKKNYDVIDTDLGERIVQLAHEKPSHIVMPALHKSKEEIGDLFVKNGLMKEFNNDPTYLTAQARLHLREKFMHADVAMTGVNFAVAKTGTFVVCTNEGNADLGVNAAKVHIASMGIEKLIPKMEHLGVFTRLLARSATGQAITTFTSHFTRPQDGKQLHLIIVDNNRTEILSLPQFRNSLKCIRCGACMNTCPVYRRSGGYSYGFTIPGPIGIALAPHHDMNEYKSLAGASTLCGSCDNVCPVKINISEQIYAWRQYLTQKGKQAFVKSAIMKMAGAILGSPFLYKMTFGAVRFNLKYFRRLITKLPLNKWGKARELPPVGKETFKNWLKQQKQ